MHLVLFGSIFLLSAAGMCTKAVDPKTRRFVRSGFALCQIWYGVDLLAFDGTRFSV